MRCVVAEHGDESAEVVLNQSAIVPRTPVAFVVSVGAQPLRVRNVVVVALFGTRLCFCEVECVFEGFHDLVSLVSGTSLFQVDFDGTATAAFRTREVTVSRGHWSGAYGPGGSCVGWEGEEVVFAFVGDTLGDVEGSFPLSREWREAVTVTQ